MKSLLLITLFSTAVLSYGADFTRMRHRSTPSLAECPGLLEPDLKDLANNLDAFDNSTSAATDTVKAASKLDRDVASCMSACNNSPVLDCKSSAQGVSYLDSTLGPANKHVIDVLVARKSVFYQYHEKVCEGLKHSLQVWTKGCGCFVNISCDDQKSASEDVCNTMLEDIQTGMDTYC